MKSIILVFLFFAIPFTIFGKKNQQECPYAVKRLTEAFTDGEEINGDLKLIRYLGEGSYAIVYEGIILKNNHTAAIKFYTIDNNISKCKQEAEMLKSLGAFDHENTNVEQFGIPAAFYYKKWNFFYVIAVTKLDIDLFHLTHEAKDGKIQNPLDILLLMRNFIYQSKYMHSHGVRHDDIKPANIMFRGYKSFIVDFNLSSKMWMDNNGGTVRYMSRKDVKRIRFAIDDWESFLYTISDVIGIELPWFKKHNIFSRLFKRRSGSKKETDEARKRIEDYLSNGELNSIAEVIKEFTNEAFPDDSSKSFPNYDHLYELVNRKITEISESESTLPPMFSWLSDLEIEQATKEITSTGPLNITEIREPSGIDFKKFRFPEVDHPAPNGIGRYGYA